MLCCIGRGIFVPLLLLLLLLLMVMVPLRQSLLSLSIVKRQKALVLLFLWLSCFS